MQFQTSCLWLLILPVLLGAQNPDVIIRPRPAKETRLAVADFQPRTVASTETRAALEVFNSVLLNDLKFSAFFDIPSKSFYPIRPLRAPRDVEFENWQVPALDVDFLILGNLQVDVSAGVLEAYLYDIKTRQQVLGKRYTVSETALLRRVAHQFADQVVYQLSAGTSRGVARSQIAYSSKKGDSKEVNIMDYDGWNSRTVTANGGLNKFASWSPELSKLAFVVKLPGVNRWELWIQDLEGGRQVLSAPSNYVSSPAFSPDGSKLAFSSREARAIEADLYIVDASGGGRRNLTHHRGIDTSPTWSPTGRQIAFISDRAGAPALWVMDADGSNLRRLVTEGGHCDSPDWSPDGRHIAYSWQAPKQWKHDIYVVEAASGKIFQLTWGRGSNEHPAWSPDGRHLALQSTRTGTKQIFIMNADGKNLKQVTAYGINESPAWSGYPKEGKNP